MTDVLVVEPKVDASASRSKQLLEKYNNLAKLIDADPVKRFASLKVAEARVAKLEAEVQARFTIKTNRKKRDKVFNYPPRDELKTLQPNTLRAEARDLLLKGATLGRIEELVADWDVRQGKKAHRLEPRAYGLVRLLHSYVGYALREEGSGPDKVIFAMDEKAWKEWKTKAAA